MLLFAGHDPGAKNHVRPIFDKAIALGERARFLDLSVQTELMDDSAAGAFAAGVKPSVFIGGRSTNQGERALFKACNALGIPAIAVVDLSAKGKFDSDTNEDSVDLFLVTNSGCIEELAEFGVGVEKVMLAGSAHLERLARTSFESAAIDLSRHYDAGPGAIMIPLFCGPDTSAAVDAVTSLGNLLPSTGLESPLVIVRPHPRAQDKQWLESACRNFEFVRYDSGDGIATPNLLAGCRMSLSMASTVSLESIVMGVPSAFYQIGWDFAGLDDLYKNVVAVARIRSQGDLQDFVDTAMARDPATKDISSVENLENFDGALERSWNIINELRAGS